MRTPEPDTHTLLPVSRPALRSLLVAMIASTGACMEDGEPHPARGDPLITLRSYSEPQVAAMSLGDGTTCVAMDDGRAKCWGHNDAGQLGRGDDTRVGDDETPGSVAFIDLGGSARQIRTNGQQTFALLDTGVIRAWGANEAFELGLGHDETIGDDEAPADASVAVDVPLGGPAVQLAVGADFACARLENGAVRCWGANDVGQLGQGDTEAIGDDESPAEVDDVALGGPAVGLTAGAHHACAWLADGTVRCWGLNDMGQLGQGHTDAIGDDETPIEVSPVALGRAAVEVVAGEAHTCARLDDGSVTCWGSGDTGQLGRGDTLTIGDDELPVTGSEVLPGEVAIALAAGARHTCAILSSGSLRCWGEGLHGQLGTGNPSNVGDDEVPTVLGGVYLGIHPVSAIFSGPTASSTCARIDGGVRCWGLGDVGQLGYGSVLSLGHTAATTPIHIPDVILVDDSDG